MSAHDVLLVDESLAVQSELRDALEMHGFRLLGVRDDVSARRAMARQSFGAIVLGLDFHRDDGRTRRSDLLRDAARSCPVVVLADGERLDTRLSALRDGAADFIAKPYLATFVVKRVRDVAQGLKSAGGPYRVLVVDDSVTYGNAVSNALARDGHDVVLATNGRDAETYLELQRPDAVFLDVFLPDVDGIDLARRLRATQATRDLPILLLTGRESTRVRERAAEARISDFAAKNTPLEALRARVPTLIAGARSGGQRMEPQAGLKNGALFDAVVVASGLSVVLGRSTLALALRRSGIEASALTPERLRAARPQIEETLKTFLSPSDVRVRMSAIESLTLESESTR